MEIGDALFVEGRMIISEQIRPAYISIFSEKDESVRLLHTYWGLPPLEGDFVAIRKDSSSSPPQVVGVVIRRVFSITVYENNEDLLEWDVWIETERHDDKQ